MNHDKPSDLPVGISIVGNYDYAGTNKFISHATADDAGRTLCGYDYGDSAGDWDLTHGTYIDDIGCQKCKPKVLRMVTHERQKANV